MKIKTNIEIIDQETITYREILTLKHRLSGYSKSSDEYKPSAFKEMRLNTLDNKKGLDFLRDYLFTKDYRVRKQGYSLNIFNDKVTGRFLEGDTVQSFQPDYEYTGTIGKIDYNTMCAYILVDNRNDLSTDAYYDSEDNYIQAWGCKVLKDGRIATGHGVWDYSSYLVNLTDTNRKPLQETYTDFFNTFSHFTFYGFNHNCTSSQHRDNLHTLYPIWGYYVKGSTRAKFYYYYHFPDGKAYLA